MSTRLEEPRPGERWSAGTRARRTLRVWGAGMMASAYLTCLATAAAAHWSQPEDVIGRIGSQTMRETLGVVEVARDPRLPRLLVVRVGEKWREAEPSARRGAAEEWWSSWRHTVSQGIVAVLEQGTDRPLVNFDPDGRAVLKNATAVDGDGKDP